MSKPTCEFCEMRNTLQSFLDKLDALPETGSPFYDEPISEAYNAIDDAKSRWQCYCEETTEAGNE